MSLGGTRGRGNAMSWREMGGARRERDRRARARFWMEAGDDEHGRR
jgi:hypothetical protein